MDQREIDIINEAITQFMGYKFTYLTYEDFSDIGGLETQCKIYSQIPLQICHRLDPIHWRDDMDKFFFITLNGWDIDPAISELKYNSSWDWLMPVVEKIEGLGFYIRIDKTRTQICANGDYSGIECSIASLNVRTKIENTFLCVYEFIIAYNKLNTTI